MLCWLTCLFWREKLANWIHFLSKVKEMEGRIKAKEDILYFIPRCSQYSVLNNIEKHVLNSLLHLVYNQTCVKRPLSKRPKNSFQDQLSLNAGQKHCILQYFRPSLSYHLSLRSLFCQYLSGRFTQFYCTFKPVHKILVYIIYESNKSSNKPVHSVTSCQRLRCLHIQS